MKRGQTYRTLEVQKESEIRLIRAQSELEAAQKTLEFERSRRNRTPKQMEQLAHAELAVLHAEKKVNKELQLQKSRRKAKAARRNTGGFFGQLLREVGL